MPTNILADRLRRLEEAGIIEKNAYQERPVRFAYTLTAKGRDMGEILIAIVRWGRKHIPGTVALDIATRAGRAPARERQSDAVARAARSRRDARVHFGASRIAPSMRIVSPLR